jgi:hypothetical protein
MRFRGQDLIRICPSPISTWHPINPKLVDLIVLTGQIKTSHYTVLRIKMRHSLITQTEKFIFVNTIF